ncbi:3-hydroxyacyl-CoA dehydrogenase NAD-binding domain-containing protein [Telluria sp. B2]
MNSMQNEVRATLASAGVAPWNCPVHAFGHDLNQCHQVSDDDRPVSTSARTPAAFSSYCADLLADLPPHGARTVGRVGIIGANPMSLGLAVSLLDADVPVTLLERERASLDQAIEHARSGYRTAVAKGELGPEQRDRRMALLAGTVNFHHLKDCDLIVDAACTDRAGKENLFRRLDQVARSGAVLATLASDAGIDHIAGCTRRAGDVLGLHVSSSSNTGEIWKIVPGKDTSGASLATVIALARKLHKVAAVPGTDQVLE